MTAEKYQIVFEFTGNKALNKMKNIVLFMLVAMATSLTAEDQVGPEILFNGVVVEGPATYFSLRFKVGPDVTRRWCSIGDEVEGFLVESYSVEKQTITLKKGTERREVVLQAGKVLFEEGTPSRDAMQARLLKEKAEFEAGRKITADLAITIDGKLVVKEMNFAIGEDATIDAGADGTYFIRAKLNQNGTLTYDVRLVAATKDEAPPQNKFRTQVTNVPWGGFSFVTTGRKEFTFLPYQ